VTTVKKGRGYVYSIQYHIVWCVKYRRKVLTGAVEEKLKEILFKIADENGFTIEEFNCDQDHVHLLIDCKASALYSQLHQSAQRCQRQIYIQRMSMA
jgi:REP element-mobilizing transposase RayT